MTDSEAASKIQPVNLEPIGDCRVLRNIDDQPGVETVEGRLVPLLSGEKIRSHVIVMHPGQYCYAHPHDTESLIFTVSGRWVFCTTEGGDEVRTVINANDMFHFPGGVPTGFETPFDEPAVILIVKSGSESYDELVEGMQETSLHLAEEASGGEPFFFSELAADHPARVFAREATGRDPVDGAA